MWEKGWRDKTWSILDTAWDLIVIGGGITGAGILRETARAGLRVLLVEAHDFASGTSSRSSKLVHGGFRYLKNGQIKLTLESVRERERLLREGRGLVFPLGFLMACFQRDKIPAWVFGAGLALYDLLALKWGHRYYDAFDICELCPPLNKAGLRGGYRYFDAQADDARLVLRLIQDAVRDGGIAINYARASLLRHPKSGQVCGVAIEDRSPGGNGRTLEAQANVVINATGAWADDLRTQIGARPRLRKLRGSHLIFPSNRLPLTRAVSFLHPQDGRPVFAIPWEGITLLGTTDVDHGPALQADPVISPEEVEYLMVAAHRAFPAQELTSQDIQATFSGVRPVIGTGKTDPSKESREHVLWCENGLITVAGGKLTTFRLMARDALKEACAHLPDQAKRQLAKVTNLHVLDSPSVEEIAGEKLSPAVRLRLSGRYSVAAPSVVASAAPGELEPVSGLSTLWAELRWAARAEGVVHLDDLLLRRVRLGLLLPEGGIQVMDRIRSTIQDELGWDDDRWSQEVIRYTNLWKRCYHFG